MAEFQRMPTQEELQKILYMGQMQGKTTQEIINENLNKGGTVKPLPENFFTTASAGAKRAGDYINRAGTAADVAKLFPGYQPETKVTIPTSFNVVPKMDPYSGQMGGTGINTQQMPIGNVLQQIKPADVLGVSGAERAYGDIGAGKAPQPFDVVDTLGLGAGGIAAGKGLLGVAKATKGMPVGLSIKETTGLLETAPKSDIGFYSAVENAAMASPRKSATGQAFLNDIMKGQDVRADEIKWMGLDDYLKDKKSITKQEVQDYIANNRVDVKEVRLGESVTEDPVGIAKRKAVFDKYDPEIQARYREMDNPAYVLINRQTGKPIQEFANNEEARNFYLSMSQEDKLSHSISPKNNSRDLQDQINEIQNLRDAEADAAYVIPESLPTKFGRYTLPGGENYREILLTMPSKKVGDAGAEDFYNNFVKTGGDKNWSELTQAEKNQYINSMPDVAKNAPTTQEYRSSHFDQPNILAHLRVNDRVDADGKKMLLIEEVQSDWHQAGRDKGYAKKPEVNLEAQKEHESILNEIGDIPWSQVPQETKDRLNALSSLISRPEKTIPDAPFKDTWYQLALKRAIQHAAENGYDRIGLTTGSQQAARFDLSKQVDNLLYTKNADGTYRVSAQIQGRGQMLGESIPESKLADYVGKEVAERMSKGVGNKTEVQGDYDPVSMTSTKKYMTELSGDGLKIGGEGMKKYYDEIYPKFLDKYGKKWGAKVGETKIRTQSDKQAQEDLDLLEQLGEDRSKFSGSGMAKVRYIDITPEMKAGVSKGQPLFMAAPIGVTGGLLGTEQDQRK